jgi:hypothetical protein
MAPENQATPSPAACSRRSGAGDPLRPRRVHGDLPLGRQVLAARLKGEAHIGLYPLLDGDRCWWLAADLDGPEAMLAHKQAEHPSRSVPAGQRAAASGRAFRATNPDIVDAVRRRGRAVPPGPGHQFRPRRPPRHQPPPRNRPPLTTTPPTCPQPRGSRTGASVTLRVEHAERPTREIIARRIAGAYASPYPEMPRARAQIRALLATQARRVIPRPLATTAEQRFRFAAELAEGRRAARDCGPPRTRPRAHTSPGPPRLPRQVAPPAPATVACRATPPSAAAS